MLSTKEDLPIYTQVIPPLPVPTQANPPHVSVKDTGRDGTLSNRVEDNEDDEEDEDEDDEDDEDEDDDDDDGEPITISLATLMKMDSSKPKNDQVKPNEPLVVECSLEDLLLGTESSRIRQILAQLRGTSDDVTPYRPKLNAYAAAFNSAPAPLSPSPAPAPAAAPVPAPSKASAPRNDPSSSTLSRKNSLGSATSSTSSLNIKAPAFTMPSPGPGDSPSRKNSVASSTTSSSRWNIKAAPFTMPNEPSSERPSITTSRRNSNASSAASTTRWNIKAAAFTMPAGVSSEGTAMSNMSRKNSNTSSTTSTGFNVKALPFAMPSEFTPVSSRSRKGSNASSTASVGFNIKAAPFVMPLDTSNGTLPSNASRRESMFSESIDVDAMPFTMPAKSSADNAHNANESHQNSDSSSTTSTDLHIIVAPFTIPNESAKTDENADSADQDISQMEELKTDGSCQQDEYRAAEQSTLSSQGTTEVEPKEEQAMAEPTEKESQTEKETGDAGGISFFAESLDAGQKETDVSNKSSAEDELKANTSGILSEQIFADPKFRTDEKEKKDTAGSSTADGVTDDVLTEQTEQVKDAAIFDLPGANLTPESKIVEATHSVPHSSGEDLTNVSDMVEDGISESHHKSLAGKHTAEDGMLFETGSAQPSTYFMTPLRVHD
ncbi:hypothetical protein BCR43DRAFT_25013 [Syncephalastrum racemosum]|uniref:Uncharacterized protein n=1 Tax=Syncephalastrum racemosum TaxID=13706 RepID=A0A1X2HTL9_SYNRA|nr:hypothetical protein BCR43DRAFT_25013 [Syncephalastrum racemosum]